jgi:hypothetical protein
VRVRQECVAPTALVIPVLGTQPARAGLTFAAPPALVQESASAAGKEAPVLEALALQRQDVSFCARITPLQQQVLTIQDILDLGGCYAGGPKRPREPSLPIRGTFRAAGCTERANRGRPGAACGTEDAAPSLGGLGYADKAACV